MEIVKLAAIGQFCYFYRNYSYNKFILRGKYWSLELSSICTGCLISNVKHPSIQWRYNPNRVLVSSIFFLQPSLFSAFLQFGVPSMNRASSWILSAHLAPGLPTGLLPSSFWLKILLKFKSVILLLLPGLLLRRP